MSKINGHNPILPRLMLLIIPLLIPAAAYTFWLHDPRVDDLERRARQLSGWSSIDCGTGGFNDLIDQKSLADTAAARACMRNAFKARQAFRVRYDNSGPGFYHSEMFVGTKQGTLHRLSIGSRQPFQEKVCSNLPCR
jgi:hypothetical protein